MVHLPRAKILRRPILSQQFAGECLQPPSSVLPPNNHNANSIHYPGAGHYPVERAYSMPQVGGGGPPTPAPLQQQYYTPQMPLLPQNHTFTFTQSTFQDIQRHDIQQSRRPGNDQRLPHSQYQPTSHLDVYRPQMPPPPQLINAQYNHHLQQSLPQIERPPNAQYRLISPMPFTITRLARRCHLPLRMSVLNTTILVNNHDLETTSAHPTHNTNILSRQCQSLTA
ncbi:hypothetical protein CPB85DRAFT_487432 [Mucidula mucida]|nr:hypothetical protein CPB85DRAFT_487432 [Mucidula mucida]